jgi:predicted ATPase
MAKKQGKARKAFDMSMDQLRHLARAGAEATLHRLRAEIAVLERTFPEFSSAKGRQSVVATVEKRARRMSASGRKAASARMKKYWAERRKVIAAKAKK